MTKDCSIKVSSETLKQLKAIKKGTGISIKFLLKELVNGYCERTGLDTIKTKNLKQK